MISSFLWGIYYFHEKVNSIALAICSVCLLVIGVCLVATTKNKEDTKGIESTDETPTMNAMIGSSTGFDNEGSGEVIMNRADNVLERDDQTRDAPSIISEDMESEKSPSRNKMNNHGYMKVMDIESDSSSSPAKPSIKYKILHFVNALIVYIVGFVTGVFDGALAVPFKASNPKDFNAIFSYLASFGLSLAVISPLICYAYNSLFRDVSKERLLLELQVAFIPGICNGLMWSLGE
jgi:hypothetical protein